MRKALAGLQPYTRNTPRLLHHQPHLTSRHIVKSPQLIDTTSSLAHLPILKILKRWVNQFKEPTSYHASPWKYQSSGKVSNTRHNSATQFHLRKYSVPYRHNLRRLSTSLIASQKSRERITAKDFDIRATVTPNERGKFEEKTIHRNEDHDLRLDPQGSSALPSEHFKRRSNLSASFNKSMERLLNSIAHLSQRVNIYTGTDYSAISALRESIVQQESLVRSRYTEVEKAKEAHAATVAAQTTSHKEVVKLLERRNSWTDSDLENYMALVRSEHTNEQAVQGAQDLVNDAETSLEEARVKLEKIERQQYHEEQIWSDTIRRNSTWVTIGLMGVNIILLGVGLVGIEPWRRRRLVREIQSALDERANVIPSGPKILTDNVSADVVSYVAEDTDQPFSNGLEDKDFNVVSSANLSSVIDEAVTVDDGNSQPHYFSPSPQIFAESWSATFSLWREQWADLFSKRRIVIAKVDLTTATLEGAAAGAAFIGLLFVILRPR